MKKRGLKLLLLAIVMTFSFGLSAIVGASADGETSFAMAGASVRTNEPSGLRFEATVDKATYESVINDSNKTFGAFILPKDYLEAAGITAITNHKAQFKAKNLEYLNREDITGSQIGNEANADYSLKYSIVDLRYYNYNRTFVGLFFIKTGDGDAATYEYATVNGANNERSIAYVSNAAIEHEESVDETAYKFALKAAYLGVNGYDDTKTEAEQNTAADTFFTENKEAAADLYAKVKAAAAIDKLNVWDETQNTAFQAAKTAYEAANPVLKAWAEARMEYATYTAKAAEFKAKYETRIQDLTKDVDSLPAADKITILSKGKIVSLRARIEEAKTALGDEYNTLSNKLTAAEEAITVNYTALIDMSTPVYKGNSEALANVKEDTLMYNTNYMAPANLAETKTQQVDDVYGSYLGSKFKNQDLSYLHICFYYKFSEAVKTSIQESSFDKVCMFVYNGSASDKDVLNSFGDGELHVSYPGVKFKAGEWTLLTVPKADFLNGYYYGIMGAQIKNTEYKFSTVFATDDAGISKINAYLEECKAAAAAEAFIAQLNALPAAPETVDENTTIPEAVTAAMTDYDALGESAKTIVNASEAYAKLEAWINIKQQIAVSYVVKAINNMEDYKSSTVPVVYSSAKYSAVAAEYEKLTEEQKALVTNYDKLKAWTDAAAKVQLLYANTKYSLYSNTNAKPGDNQFNVDVENIPAELNEYGFISRVWYNASAENVRLAFKNLPNLTGYDVVRFPIYLRPDQVGTNRYPLVYKFENESLVGGYRTMTAGWNIVTIPVSKMYEGIQIGVNMIPAKTILHYAIPYAEKLENGDKISTFAYETNIAYSTVTTFTDAYRANVAFDKIQTVEGNILKVVTSSGSGGAGANYAFRMNDYQEYKTIVADSGATGVEFKIYKNGTGGSVYLYPTEDTSGHDKGIKEITLQNNGWVTVSLTAEEFARWNGYFRRTGGAGTELYVADFTIVK